MARAKANGSTVVNRNRISPSNGSRGTGSSPDLWEGQDSARLLQQHLASLEKQLAHADLQLGALKRALNHALIVLEAIDGRGGVALSTLLERRLPRLDPYVLADVARLVDDQVEAARLLSPEAFRQ